MAFLVFRETRSNKSPVSHPSVVTTMVAMLLTLWCAMPCSLRAEARHARSLAPAPANLTIKDVTMTGSGCPTGSAVSTTSSDHETIVVKFADFEATTDPAGKTQEECVITVKLECPSGSSYSVSSLQYFGYVRLEKGVSAKLYGSYKHDGGSPSCVAEEIWNTGENGEVDDGFQEETSCSVWTPCDGVLKTAVVHTTLSVDNTSNSTASAYLVLDTLDLLVSTKQP